MKSISHKFVEFIPDQLEEGILYISVKYCTAVHKCFCGCGQEVVTPLSPTDWELIFNGKSVTLYPSIGNWSLECRSHYWIKNDRVEWAKQWSDTEIKYSRNQDRFNKETYYNSSKQPEVLPDNKVRFWHKFKKWLS